MSHSKWFALWYSQKLIIKWQLNAVKSCFLRFYCNNTDFFLIDFFYFSTRITTRVTRTMPISVPGGAEDSERMGDLMEKIVDQFVAEERKGQWTIYSDETRWIEDARNTLYIDYINIIYIYIHICVYRYINK